MTTTTHSLTSDHLTAFRAHINACMGKTPFGLHIDRDAQETPEKFWALGFIYSESDEVYRKRCFHSCGSKKKHVVACRNGLPVIFSFCKSTGKFTVGLRPGFEHLNPEWESFKS